MTSSEAQGWVKLAFIGVGIYVGYQVYKGFKGNIAPNLTGPAPGQTWLNYFFGSGGTLDAQGNYVAPVPIAAPNPDANKDMGGKDFGVTGNGW
jgi:hypothetical protein